MLSLDRHEFGADDFDWPRYHLEYAKQLALEEESWTLRLAAGQWSMSGGSLQLDSGLPLHPNHKVLYETLIELSPDSILEAGCGGGDHLHNLAMLMPEVELRGIDRSQGQLGLLSERNPQFVDQVRPVDLTMPHPKDVPPAEAVFTQAVLMHIQTGNGHRVALWNLMSLSSKYVILVENTERHDLMEDIRLMRERGLLPWDDLHTYVRRIEGQPSALVLSQIRLPWEPAEAPGTA
jgi:hypothetical protein